ncbi:MAG: hypothetical protein E7K04_05815, partial [Helicobacter sp.]|nr:hypothetical protein [Helicobacter sp.]
GGGGGGGNILKLSFKIIIPSIILTTGLSVTNANGATNTAYDLTNKPDNGIIPILELRQRNINTRKPDQPLTYDYTYMKQKLHVSRTGMWSFNDSTWGNNVTKNNKKYYERVMAPGKWCIHASNYTKTFYYYAKTSTGDVSETNAKRRNLQQLTNIINIGAVTPHTAEGTRGNTTTSTFESGKWLVVNKEDAKNGTIAVEEKVNVQNKVTINGGVYNLATAKTKYDKGWGTTEIKFLANGNTSSGNTSNLKNEIKGSILTAGSGDNDISFNKVGILSAGVYNLGTQNTANNTIEFDKNNTPTTTTTSGANTNISTIKGAIINISNGANNKITFNNAGIIDSIYNLNSGSNEITFKSNSQNNEIKGDIINIGSGINKITFKNTATINSNFYSNNSGANIFIQESNATANNADVTKNAFNSKLPNYLKSINKDLYIYTHDNAKQLTFNNSTSTFTASTQNPSTNTLNYTEVKPEVTKAQDKIKQADGIIQALVNDINKSSKNHFHMTKALSENTIQIATTTTSTNYSLPNQIILAQINFGSTNTATPSST